jgi:hypothetical protein
MTKQRALMAGVVVAGLLAAVGSMQASSEDRRTVLTFSGPVGLPGVTLAAGSYVFELASPSAGIVRVSNQQGVVYMHFTERVQRPNGLRDDVAVRFGEAAPGAVAPISEWYHPGERTGHRFIYRRQ